jgi:hypothetical protein
VTLDEKFTVCINNSNEKPVRKTLVEMTADDVLRALAWHQEEAARQKKGADKAHRTIRGGFHNYPGLN